jgi:hypothetical protein
MLSLLYDLSFINYRLQTSFIKLDTKIRLVNKYYIILFKIYFINSRDFLFNLLRNISL